MQHLDEGFGSRLQNRSVVRGGATLRATLALGIALMTMHAHAIDAAHTRFTKLDSAGNSWRDAAEGEPWSCVLDHSTGLTWEMKVRASGLRAARHTYTADALPSAQSVALCATQFCDAPSYIAAVNAIGLCGARDWRLPTREELRSLVDYTRPYPGPTIDANYFPNTVANFYWSATPDASDAGSAWGLGFAHGFDYAYPKQNAAHVRLVRGSTSPSEPRFTIDDGNTVRDRHTALIWQRCSVGQQWYDMTCADRAQPMTYAQAHDHVQQHQPWRLPTLVELSSVVDLDHHSPAVNAALFPNTALRSYWTATPLAINANLQWCVNFMYGDSYADDATASAYVRLVRDATLEK